MQTHADKIQEAKGSSVANVTSEKQSDTEPTFQFVDNRPETMSQRNLQEAANNSSQINQLKGFQEMANRSPQIKQVSQFQVSDDTYLSQQESVEKEVVQLKPAKVKGQTHLVKKKGESLMKGTPGKLLVHNESIDVEADKLRLKSRRGPNQERVGDYDERGEHIYRWYLVNEIPEEIVEPGTYIREGTFNFENDHDLPKGIEDLSEKDDKRTRKSHYAVRFEIWFNTSESIDPSGHMVMKEMGKKVNPYLAYEWTPDGHPQAEQGNKREAPLMEGDSPIKEHDHTKVNLKDVPGGGNFITLDPKREEPEQIEQRLKGQQKYESTKKKDTWYKVKTDLHKKKDTVVNRFNKKKWIEVLISNEEFAYMNSMFDQRSKQGGFYCYFREARTTLDFDLATRCLSVIEDVAIHRGQSLKTGHATSVLRSFATINEVTEKHASKDQDEDV